MKFEFDTKELGKKILKEINIWSLKDEYLPSNVIWETLLEEVEEFEYAIYDEVVEQLEKEDITVVEC